MLSGLGGMVAQGKTRVTSVSGLTYGFYARAAWVCLRPPPSLPATATTPAFFALAHVGPAVIAETANLTCYVLKHNLSLQVWP